MKNVILLCVLIALLSSSSFAQGPLFGVKGGINVATIGRDPDVTGVSLGFHFGGFVQVYKSDHIILQPEAIFSLQGASLKGDFSPRANYRYLNFPVIFKYYPGFSGIHLQAGPQIGVLFSGEISSTVLDIPFLSHLNPVDYVFAIGIGFDHDDLLIDLRYNYGLNSTEPDAGYIPGRTFQFSLGYIF